MIRLGGLAFIMQAEFMRPAAGFYLLSTLWVAERIQRLAVWVLR